MKYIIIKLIKLYQLIPINSHYQCKFYPTCSNYMIEALNEYGLFKGLYLGIKRILKCNPFNKCYGYDPVRKENYEKNI